jgi:hypothetical protein
VPGAATAEFKRYIGGNGNIALSSGSIPQITGSNQISPAFHNNTFQGAGFFMRTPVSSSAWTISSNTWNNFGSIAFGTAQATSCVSASAGASIVNNFAAGTLNVTAYKTQLYSPIGVIQSYFGGTLTLNNDSSSIQFTNSIQAGSLTVNSSYNSGTTTQANSTQILAGGLFAGAINNIYVSGSNATTTNNRQIYSSAIIGMSNSASVNLNGDNSNMNSVALIGHSLAVTASSAFYNTATGPVTGSDRGTVIVGRFNKEVLSGNTVFAVGSGLSYSTRKNAILVDSGSNIFLEGTLNISGSTTMTGSLILSSSNFIELQVIGNMVVTGSAYGNVVPLSITSNTASMDLSLGNYFTLTLADSATTHISASNVLPGVSATLVITTGTNSSASLAPTMLQPSGSAYSATNGSAKKDVLSIVSVASGVPYVVSTLNMI